MSYFYSLTDIHTVLIHFKTSMFFKTHIFVYR